MRKLWTISPNLFLPLATLCQTGRHRVEKLQLSRSPTGAKKCVHFHPIALTPAAFAWVASRALTESLLFLQSSQIDLIINRYSEQIQVFFISRKHLLSQTRERLAGKHRQRTLGSGLPEYIRQLSLPSCNNECMHSFYHISYLYMLILWISASTEWAAFLISSPLLYYGCWRHLSQRNPSHMPRPAARPKTVTNGALNKSIRAKSCTAWTTVMAWVQTWRQLAQSSKGKLMRQLAFFPERYSLNKSARTSRALTDAALGADWDVRPRFISSPRGSQYSHLHTKKT